MFTVVLKKLVVALMVCNVFLLGLSPVAEARIISTQESIQVTQRDQQLAQINTVILRSDVQEQMLAFGVDPRDVQERLAVLSDEELKQLASQMQDMVAGGDSVLAVIGIVFLVLLILELVGVTNIFTRI
ncbi:MAG: PA2779 family protein [Thermodesulfobacteriota bacterium]